jgi:hypothetical protein
MPAPTARYPAVFYLHVSQKIREALTPPDGVVDYCCVGFAAL